MSTSRYKLIVEDTTFTFHHSINRYLYDMRLLLSFILTSLLFVAPHRGDATPSWSKETPAAIAHNLSQSDEAGDFEFSHKPTAALFSSQSRTHFNQGKFQFDARLNYSGQWSLITAQYFGSTPLEAPYLRCVSIGQKLLFPDHYFW